MGIAEVKVPPLTEDSTHAVVRTWLVREGDAVHEGEDLAVMLADEAVFHVPVPLAGTVREILVDEGEAVEVGALLVILETPDEGA